MTQKKLLIMPVVFVVCPIFDNFQRSVFKLINAQLSPVGSVEQLYRYQGFYRGKNRFVLIPALTFHTTINRPTDEPVQLFYTKLFRRGLPQYFPGCRIIDIIDA